MRYQFHFSLKDFAYLVTLFCVLAAVCSLDGGYGAIPAIVSCVVAPLLIVAFREIDFRLLWAKLKFLFVWAISIKPEKHDMIHMSVALITLLLVSWIEEGFYIAAMSILISIVTIYVLRERRRLKIQNAEHLQIGILGEFNKRYLRNPKN